MNVGTWPKELLSIMLKAKRMEAILKRWTNNSECYDERDYCGECHHCIARDTLAFDPLSDNEAK